MRLLSSQGHALIQSAFALMPTIIKDFPYLFEILSRVLESAIDARKYGVLVHELPSNLLSTQVFV